MKRSELADLITERLGKAIVRASDDYRASSHEIGYFCVDDVLPASIVKIISERFPKPEHMMLKKSLREDKYVAAQMDKYDPLLEETIYAFQDPRIVSQITQITKIPDLTPDHNLYAGGISLMRVNQFLNPHLDNSHDKDRNQWRVLNLLYYVTPDWPDDKGGNLELWPSGPKGKPITIHSKFNRLAVMATHHLSWHSVSPISTSLRDRCCVSNYYFSPAPLKPADEFHVTSFRARPGQPIRNLVLRTDASLRMLIRKFFRKGIRQNPHVYKK